MSSTTGTFGDAAPEAETPAEEYGRLRRELSETGYETPEHGMILDRMAVLAADARDKLTGEAV